jgi:hypothetical protein
VRPKRGFFHVPNAVTDSMAFLTHQELMVALLMARVFNEAGRVGELSPDQELVIPAELWRNCTGLDERAFSAAREGLARKHVAGVIVERGSESSS